MFVVLEGIDGAGCGAQRKALEKRGKIGNKPIFTLKYPHYKDDLGKTIHRFLHRKLNLSVYSQFLLYSLQMVAEREKIASLRKKGILISDRYFTSTLAYQGTFGFPLQKALEFARMFQIEVPDLVIFLDVRPETAFGRKLKEEGKEELDQNESNLSLIRKVDSMYRKFIENQVFSRWIKVNGERPIEEVTGKIVEIIKRKLGEG